MPTKVDPGTLAIGNGKAAQDSVSVSSLDFAHVVDFQAALSGHLNDPIGAHPATAISTQDTYGKFDWTHVEGSLNELSDLMPDLINTLGQEQEGVPNSGVPYWGTLEDTYDRIGTTQSGGFTCTTANHAHASWSGGNQGGTPGNWLVETHCLLQSSITTFDLSGILYPADRGYLVLLYAKNGVFDNTVNTIEVGELDLEANFSESYRRVPNYQQPNYVGVDTHDSGPDIFTLTYRLPALKEYSAGTPYEPYDFNYLQFQLAYFSVSIDLTLSPFNIGVDVDFGSLKLFHFKTYSNVATADYSASNLYGSHGKYDIYSEVDPGLPVIGTPGTDYIVEPTFPVGTETPPGGSYNCDLASPNDFTSASAVFAGDATDRGKILTVTGSVNGNNGDYQILVEDTTTHVKVYPDFPGSLPETTLNFSISAPNIFRLSGIYHYGSDNGFWLKSSIAGAVSGLWNLSYLTGVESDSKVSSGYLSDKSPLKYDLTDFGAGTREIPYHLLDNNDAINPTDGWDLSKGNGPGQSDDAEYIGVLISGSSGGGVSDDAKVKNTIRTPFALTELDAITQTGNKILTNAYEQIITGRSQIEDFTTELFRYHFDVAQDENTDLFEHERYPLVPYTRATPNIGNDGVVSSTNTLTSATANFTSGDTGRTILISSVKLYWSDSTANKIQRSNIDGSSVEDVVTGIGDAAGLALDINGGKIYWANATDQKVQRANFDGSSIEDLVTGLGTKVFAVALDLAVGKMYWADSDADKIQRSNLDGSDVEDVVLTGVGNLQSLALNHNLQKVYWSDQGTSKIQRANFDGSDVEDVITGASGPNNIAFDYTEGKMYWTETAGNSIRKANFDGSSAVNVLTGLSWPRGMAINVEERKIYWFDGSTNNLRQTDFDGSYLLTLNSGISNMPHIAYYDNPVYDGSYKATYVSSTQITVEPDWPTHIETSVSWYFPTVWDSDLALGSHIQNELQVLDGKLVYPQTNFTAGYYPSNGQQNYATLFAADVANTIRWYTRLIDTQSPANSGKIRIKGISDSAFAAGVYTGDLVADHSGGAVVLMKVPGVTGWLDLGRYDGDPNSDKTQDYYGCLTFAFYTQDIQTGVGTTYGIALDTDSEKIYWADSSSGDIKRSDFDGSNIETIHTGLGSLRGIAIDANGGKLYWVDFTGFIYRSNIDGSNIETIISGLSFPRCLALDIDAGKLYYGGNGGIKRSNLDGSDIEDIIIIGTVGGLSLDTNAEKVYWFDILGTKKILRANLDGSSVEVLVDYGIDPTGIAVDAAGGKIYWVDTTGTDYVKRANLDGSDIEDVIGLGSQNPTAIVLDVSDNIMYWAEDSSSKIRRANMDGSGIYSYNTEFYTQDNGDGGCPIAIRIGFIKDGTGENHEVESIEWLP